MAIKKSTKKQTTSKTEPVSSLEEENLIIGEEKKSKLKKKFYFLLFVILIAVLLAVVYFFIKYEQVKSQLATNSSPAETNEIIQQVGKLIELPNEQPQLATVTDIAKLKGQLFFAHAKDGDKVLIYPNANEAILYDPNENKIVNVASIDINNTHTAQITPTLTPVATVLYNGTNIVGFTKIVENKLKTSYPQVNIIDKENASSNSYQTTTLIDLSNTNQSLIKQ